MSGIPCQEQRFWPIQSSVSKRHGRVKRRDFLQRHALSELISAYPTERLLPLSNFLSISPSAPYALSVRSSGRWPVGETVCQQLAALPTYSPSTDQPRTRRAVLVTGVYLVQVHGFNRESSQSSVGSADCAKKSSSTILIRHFKALHPQTRPGNDHGHGGQASPVSEQKEAMIPTLCAEG